MGRLRYCTISRGGKDRAFRIVHFAVLHVLSRSISVLAYNLPGGDRGRTFKGQYSVVSWVVLNTHVLGVTDNVLNIHGNDPTHTDQASQTPKPFTNVVMAETASSPLW